MDELNEGYESDGGRKEFHLRSVPILQDHEGRDDEWSATWQAAAQAAA